MNKFFTYLKQRLPDNWNVISQDSGIVLRDSSIEQGQGYTVKVEETIMGYKAVLQFEDFARILFKHAETQLLNRSHPLEHLFINNRHLSLRRYKTLVEDVFRIENSGEDAWWLVIEQKKEDKDFSIEVFTDIILSVIIFLFPYAIEGEEEGAREQTLLTRIERSYANRALCLAFHGYSCKVCGVRLQEQYGPVANDFIHVHHLTLVSQANNCALDPIKDMIPICPNCHSIAHLRNPPYSIEEIKQMLNQK